MNPGSIQNHILPSKNYSKLLAQILKPLFQNSHVEHFGYNRFYKNQTWIGLYSDFRPIEMDLLAGRGPLFVNETGIAIDSGTYLHKDLHDLLKLNVSNQLVDDFFYQENNPLGKKVVQNGMLLIRKGAHYDESFYFSLLDKDIPDRLYYQCIVNELKKFCLYFVDKSRKIIDESEKLKTKYNLPKKDNCDFSSFFIKSLTDKDWVDVKKFCFSTPYGDTYLSKQELTCLRLLAEGLSHEEISCYMDISKRTVESYTENIRNKLSTTSKEELVSYYRCFSVMDTITLE